MFTADKISRPRGASLPLVVVALALILGWSEVCRAQVESPADDGVQVGFGPGVIVPVNERVEFFALGAAILGEQTTSLAQLDVRYEVNKYLTVSPGYFGLFVPKAGGRRNRDHRARLAATLNFGYKKLKISDRNLVERRFRTTEDATRYRNQIRLEHPVALGRTNFNVYGYTEPVYDFGEKRWTRNFAALGVSKTFAERYSGEVYYFGQFVRGGRRIDAVVFGLTVRLPQLFKKGS